MTDHPPIDLANLEHLAAKYGRTEQQITMGAKQTTFLTT